ncbi:MAG: hypothetical protein GF404_11310 [candidate division Zixibacteria bacterium]|nr:hypothetical protein [candidate division Zixibacteria bacterium]
MIEISPLALNHRLELGQNDDSHVHVMAGSVATTQSVMKRSSLFIHDDNLRDKASDGTLPLHPCSNKHLCNSGNYPIHIV